MSMTQRPGGEPVAGHENSAVGSRQKIKHRLRTLSAVLSKRFHGSLTKLGEQNYIECT